MKFSSLKEKVLKFQKPKGIIPRNPRYIRRSEKPIPFRPRSKSLVGPKTDEKVLNVKDAPEFIIDMTNELYDKISFHSNRYFGVQTLHAYLSLGKERVIEKRVEDFLDKITDEFSLHIGRLNSFVKGPHWKVKEDGKLERIELPDDMKREVYNLINQAEADLNALIAYYEEWRNR